MRRRDIILVPILAATRPAGAQPHPAGRVRRVAVLVGLSENDPGMEPRLTALRDEFEKLGWVEGQNLRVERRYAPGGVGAQELAKQIVELQPEVVIAHTVSVASALQRQTRTIPVVFVSVGDPLGTGLVASLARPGGNLTGLMTFERSIPGKWVAMLKEIVPRLGRVLFLGNAKFATYDYYRSGAEAAAQALGVTLVPASVETASEIQIAIEQFLHVPDGALVVVPDLTTSSLGSLIVLLAARYRLPAVYAFSYLVSNGGLMSYGTDRVAEMRQAASYVDRILRGAAPGELPVQTPIQFETAVNLRTAKALGLEIPAALLARADEVIE